MRLRDRPWWPWLTRGAGLVFATVVTLLLVRYARGVDWREVQHSLLDLRRTTLLQAFAFAVVSHLVYSLLDLVGRHYTGHALSRRQVMQVSFTSYAFNLNLGSLVGGIGFRYRLYSRLGLRPGEITRIVTLSMLTNWLGYVLLAGLVFTIAPLELPPHWKLDSEGLQLVGVLLLAAAIGYVALCFRMGNHSFDVRGHEVFVPTPRMAIFQFLVSGTHWLTMAAVVWVLLEGRLDFATTLSVLLIAAIAGVITHIPAGLGVVEAVFIALLAHRVPEHQLLGSLLAYRALFYLLPLLGGALLYLRFEFRTRKPATAT